MATITQTGIFAQGQSGYVLRIEVNTLSHADWMVVDTLALNVFRPDGSEFDRTPGLSAIVDDGFEYVTQDGDFPIDGHYGFVLTLTSPGKILPVSGSFDISDIPE